MKEEHVAFFFFSFGVLLLPYDYIGGQCGKLGEQLPMVLLIL